MLLILEFVPACESTVMVIFQLQQSSQVFERLFCFEGISQNY